MHIYSKLIFHQVLHIMESFCIGLTSKSTYVDTSTTATLIDFVIFV